MANTADGNFLPVPVDEFRALLQHAVLTRAKTHLWTSGQRHRLHSKLIRTFDSGHHTYVSLSDEAPEAAFETSVKKEGIDVCFNVLLPTDILFFKCEIKRRETGFLNFRVVEPVYKVQRRRSLRLPIGESMNIIAVFTEPKTSTGFAGTILDLSDGGLCLLIEDERAGRLIVPGVVLERLTFSIGSRVFSGGGEVRYLKEIKSTRVKASYKCGLAFKGFNTDDREFIATFVLEESVRFFGRL